MMARRLTSETGYRTRTVHLVAREDAQSGEMGLVVEGMNISSDELNSASEGLLIAHDLLEHVNGVSRIGSIADELEALGGLWFVRGQHGELRRDSVGSAYTISQNVASDITRMFRDWFYSGSRETLQPPRTRACDVEADLDDILREAARGILDEIEPEDHAEARQLSHDYLRACRGFMRIGYRKASRNFAGRGWLANALFWRIAEVVNPHAKHVEFEGQQFTLTYGAKDGTAFAWCEEFYPDDY